jgi:hypothetical protein
MTPQPPAPNFVRVEDRRGQLLFEFDPARDLIRIKTRRMDRPALIDLAQYRAAAAEAGPSAAQGRPLDGKRTVVLD